MGKRKLHTDVDLQWLFPRAVNDILGRNNSSYLPAGVLIRNDHAPPDSMPVRVRVGKHADWTEEDNARAELEVRNLVLDMHDKIGAKIRTKMGSAREAILIPVWKPLPEQENYGEAYTDVGNVVLVRGTKPDEITHVFFHLEFYVLPEP